MALRSKKEPKDEAAGSGEAKRKREKAPRSGGKSKSRPSKAKKVSGKRFVIIVGDEGAILVFMQGAKVVRRLFAPSAQPSHTEAMREIMTTNPTVPVYLLADVLDQQYIPHSFPPVSALSVSGLVKRRMDRDFQADDLKGSISLGRDKTGRREWKYLLIGLAKSELMSAWIDLVVELPNEMKGIYLVPVESVNYLALLSKRLPQEKPLEWQLFISHNKVSGFRQVVVHNGKLVFTRVSQAIDDAVAAVIAGNIEQEIINTIEYLKRLGFGDVVDLEAVVVISHDVAESIDLKRFGFGRTQVFSPLKIAETLGLEQAALSADRFGDVVMAAAFGITKKHTLRFASAYMNRLAALYKARLAIRAVGALLVILFVLLAGASVVGAIQDYSSISEATAKATNLKPRLKKQQDDVGGLNKNVAFKTALVATYDVYLKNVPLPVEFAKDIAPFIAVEHRLLSLNWVYAATDKAPAPATGAALPLEVKAEFDFSGAGSSIEALNQAGNALLDDLKAKLPQYEVTVEPFPWLKEETKQEEITLEISQAAAISAQNMIAKFTFKGPKAVANAPAAASPTVAPAVVLPGGQP